MREALTSALRSGRQMWVLTVTFPGFGGCKSYCGCHGARAKFGTDIGEWNGGFTERFNDLITEVRRLCGVDVQYERYLEPQCGDRIKDGRAPTWAFHGHVVLAAALSTSSMGSWSKRRWRKLLAAHGFGHSFVLRPIECHGDVDAAVSYVTGYAKNVADELRAAPYVHPGTGERRPSRCRPFTSSRMFSESVAAMRQRYATDRARAREAAQVAQAAVDEVDSAADCALESLIDELRIRGMLGEIVEAF
jgi:hypothetical protein